MTSKEKEQQIQAAIELEREVVTTMARVKVYDQSIGQLKRNIQKCHITLKENLWASGQSVNIIHNDMVRFLLRPKLDIANDIVEIVKQNEKDILEYDVIIGFYLIIPTHKKARIHLVSKAKEKEQQLQEQVRTLKM